MAQNAARSAALFGQATQEIEASDCAENNKQMDRWIGSRMLEDTMPLLSEELCDTPIWLEDLPEWAPSVAELPEKVDVLVIGSGYTGLNTALETARAGRSTLVIDAAAVGAGCSTRNGGQISNSVKPRLPELTHRHGRRRAEAMRHAGIEALDWIEERIRQEAIACDFKRNGLFRAAHTPAHYQALLADVPVLAKESIEAEPVAPSQVYKELGTDAYHGGLVFPYFASLHPGRYHRGLLQSAVDAGVQVVERCAASTIERQGKNRYRVQTEKGYVAARDVVVATNGYTDSLTPWLRCRIIPIGSYVMCTEPLPLELIDRLFPTGRHVTDTCRIVYYYRASPDRRRVIFGGRVSTGETDLRTSARRLHRQLCRRFPELAPARITHSWSGRVAYSFDERVHIGQHDGIHYALGYCGSGVSMASYMGMKLGLKVLSHPEGSTAFDNLPFPTRPLYRGRPWFLPPLVAFHRLRDECQWWQARPRTKGTGVPE